LKIRFRKTNRDGWDRVLVGIVRLEPHGSYNLRVGGFCCDVSFNVRMRKCRACARDFTQKEFGSHPCSMEDVQAHARSIQYGVFENASR
jgi:hypothetical protein